MPDGGIERLDPDDPQVRQIIAAADDFYRALYPAESNHLESAEALKRPGTIFVGCRVEGQLAASGAARIMSDDGTYAEIKRLFVLDQYRGRGLSYRIMEYLEAQLRGQGIELLRLETGVYQPAAIAIYRRLGYVERGPFGAYRPDPLSIFMEKRVAVGPVGKTS
jgi:putative acetyltransferase